MTQATPSLVTTEVDGHVFLIGLNRPDKRNAANLQMLSELALAYGELDRRDDLRVGVVFAHGEHFSAGLDLADVGPAMATTGSLPIPHGGLDPWGISTEQVILPGDAVSQFTLGRIQRQWQACKQRGAPRPQHIQRTRAH